MASEEIIGYTFALLSGLFFGLSDAFVRAAAVKLKPLQNLLISLVVGSPILWIFALFKGSLNLSLEACIYFVLAGLLNFVVGRLLFYIAITNIGATAASIVTTPTVVVSALLAWLFLGESLSLVQLAGIFLVVSAVLLVSVRPSGIPLHGGRASMGVIAGLSSTLVFATTAVIVRHATGYLHGDPLVGVAISYTSALPIVIVLNRGVPDPMSLPRKQLYYMTLAAVVVALAQLSRYLAFNFARVAEASVIIALFPFFTLLFTFIFKHEMMEKPRAVHLLASLLAVIGIMLTNYYG